MIYRKAFQIVPQTEANAHSLHLFTLRKGIQCGFNWQVCIHALAESGSMQWTLAYLRLPAAAECGEAMGLFDS